MLFSLNVHTEPHGNPENLKFLAETVVPTLHDNYGVRPTFCIQAEPPQCSKINLFHLYPDIIKELSKYGEIALHNHFIHDRSYEHQKLHIDFAATAVCLYPSIRTWVSGDWLTDKNTFKILEKTIIKIDSSVLPAKHPWRSPRIPYYPSKWNIHKPGGKNAFDVLEVPNTPRIRTDNQTTIKMQYYTEEQIRRVKAVREDIPVVMPCHSYDFLTVERFWVLQGYLLWLTSTYDTKMVTVKDFLKYPVLKPSEYNFTFKDLVRDVADPLFQIFKKVLDIEV